MPIHRPVPAPIHITPSVNPGIVHRPVVVEPRVVAPVVQLPANRPVVTRPVVVAPAVRPVVAAPINPGLHQRPVVVTHPVRLPEARVRAINTQWRTAIGRPFAAVDYHQKYHSFAVPIQAYFRPHQYEWFNQGWWGPRLAGAGFPYWHYSHYFGGRPYLDWWRPLSWLAVAGWYGAQWGPPLYYDYGGNVVYRDNSVYINDVPVATQQEFANQAFDLASELLPPPQQQLEWMPMGVFALASSKDDRQPKHVLQLAITKQGFISGTLFNTATQKSIAAEGHVDPATQRVAIRFPEKADFVLETGMYNLTQEQTPVLVHFGTQSTQTWYLVRLPPEAQK